MDTVGAYRVERNKKRQNRKAKFSGRKHSTKGIISLVLGLLCVILQGILLYLAFLAKGEINVYFGSVGVLLLFINIIPVYLGIKSIKEDDVYLIAPIFGTIVSVIGLIGYIGIYGIGFYF